MCPDENMLSAMIQGFLDPEEVRQIEVHLDGCPSCMEEMADLAELLAQPDAGERQDEPSMLPRIGRYEILHELGAGAQGVVYAAFDPSLQRQVALKIVRPDRASESQREQQRLQREARLLAGLSHPHVLPIHEVGPYPGGLFLVTELVRGGTLRELGQRERPWQQIVEIWLGAGRGLAAAHRAGIVHRDVKPDNFLLHEDGRALLTDFGLASAQPTATLQGTPLYLAPELLLGEPATAKSDQFAFCVGLYEALHGTRPFWGSTLDELAGSVQRRALVRGPRRVPARLTRVLQRGLSYDPRQRYPRMEELLEALEAAARPRRWPLAALAGAALAAGALGLWWTAPAAERPTAEFVPVASPIPAPAPGEPWDAVWVAFCDKQAREVEPTLTPCEPDNDLCRASQISQIAQVAGCYEAYGRCEAYHRWQARLADLYPEDGDAWRATSYRCPPSDVVGRALHLSTFGAVEIYQGVEQARAVGEKARALAREQALSPKVHEKLWTLQETVVLVLRDYFRKPKEAEEEAKLAFEAFGKRIE